MSNLPSGASNDSNAPFNDKSNDQDLSHLCPSCDDVGDEANNLIDYDNYETEEEYDDALDKLIYTAQLCKECHDLDRYELD